MARKVDTEDDRAAEIAEAGIRAMACVVWGQTVPQDLMIDAALRVLWAWRAPPSEHLLRRRSAAPGGDANQNKQRGHRRKSA
jgi:hypothetical protein